MGFPDCASSTIFHDPLKTLILVLVTLFRFSISSFIEFLCEVMENSINASSAFDNCYIVALHKCEKATKSARKNEWSRHNKRTWATCRWGTIYFQIVQRIRPDTRGKRSIMRCGKYRAEEREFLLKIFRRKRDRQMLIRFSIYHQDR